jgi:F-type H+-transporting ATPase subunit b
VAKLPNEARHNLADAGGSVEIVTAVPLDTAQQTACETMMDKVLGQTPALVFRTDPALIAGVEVHMSGLLIRNSWQADLERIAGELQQNEPHVAETVHLV